MASDRELFLEFQRKWNKEKVQKMSLEEYTSNSENYQDTFTYWIEHKLLNFGSIKGKVAYKFGIFTYNNKPKAKPLKQYNNQLPRFDDKYAWLENYGNTAQEAFDKVKNEILKIIEFSQNNELEKIDEINLDIMYKWKVAFHYQNPDNMKILDIFKMEALDRIYKIEKKEKLKKYPNFHRTILDNDKFYTLEEIHSKATELWNKYEQEKTNKNLNSFEDTHKDENLENRNKTMQDKIMKDFPLNQILYGPPGTGKTYEVVNLALQILGERISENRKESKAKFDEYRKNGQIEFVTFHQSYGYEEFVEGIKPVFDDENSQTNELKYEIKDGIFKEICEKARKNLENSQKTLTQLNLEIDLENSWNEYIAYLNEKISNGENVFIKESSKMKIINADEQTISISTGENNSYQGLSKTIFMRDYDKFTKGEIKSYKDIKPAYESRASFHGNAIYYFELFKQISKFEKNSKVKSKKATQEQEKSYILIIDEINRGNISKIFGELITLIEKSKRVGNSEELKVKLPYSWAEFGVPKNLYIIGTMNTADRSIALIDTALRRRFEFVEMMPKAEILGEIESVNLQELLKAMNERIEFLLDREHTIGHAYFMSVENLGDLKQVFKNKIIPLLQEYFYDDYEKIRAVLNDTDEKFIEKIEQKDLKYKIKGFDDLFDSEKCIYKICKFDDLTADDFKKIYTVKEQNNSNE